MAGRALRTAREGAGNAPEQPTVDARMQQGAERRLHAPLAGADTEVIAALPADEFPLMTGTARVARTVEAADEFAGGLDLMLRGLASRAGRVPGGRP